jgi:hypothetical protein
LGESPLFFWLNDAVARRYSTPLWRDQGERMNLMSTAAVQAAVPATGKCPWAHLHALPTLFRGNREMGFCHPVSMSMLFSQWLSNGHPPMPSIDTASCLTRQVPSGWLQLPRGRRCRSTDEGSCFQEGRAADLNLPPPQARRLRQVDGVPFISATIPCHVHHDLPRT